MLCPEYVAVCRKLNSAEVHSSLHVAGFRGTPAREVVCAMQIGSVAPPACLRLPVTRAHAPVAAGEGAGRQHEAQRPDGGPRGRPQRRHAGAAQRPTPRRRAALPPVRSASGAGCGVAAWWSGARSRAAGRQACRGARGAPIPNVTPAPGPQACGQGPRRAPGGGGPDARALRAAARPLGQAAAAARCARRPLFRVVAASARALRAAGRPVAARRGCAGWLGVGCADWRGEGMCLHSCVEPRPWLRASPGAL